MGMKKKSKICTTTLILMNITSINQLKIQLPFLIDVWQEKT